MSSFGSQMRKRLEELRKAGEDVQTIMKAAAKAESLQAFEKGMESAG